jgi:hypothetical protein
LQGDAGLVELVDLFAEGFDFGVGHVVYWVRH